MKRTIQGLLTVSFLVVLWASPARADVTKVSGGLGCGANITTECNPTQPLRVRQGTVTVLKVKGQDVNFAEKNDVDVSGSGVTARIIKDHLVAPGESVGTGQADVELSVPTNTAAGERTVTLNHNCFGCSTPRKYTFKILVVHFGKVTSVSGTEPNDFFQEVNLTFTGERLGDAGVKVVPPSTSSSSGGSQFPQVVTTPNPDGTTAEIINNTETSIQVRLRFPELRAETTQRLQFFDKNCNCSVYQGLNNNVLFSEVTIRAKDNFVQAIEFPFGNSVTVGSVFTIKIKLVRTVRAAAIRDTGPTIGSVIRAGERVKWNLLPNVFLAIPGSGTPFNPTADNFVTIPPGNDSVTLTVRLAQAPGGCPQQGCNGQIQTRMNNFNSDQPPFFKSAQFTILSGN